MLGCGILRKLIVFLTVCVTFHSLGTQLTTQLRVDKTLPIITHRTVWRGWREFVYKMKRATKNTEEQGGAERNRKRNIQRSYETKR